MTRLGGEYHIPDDSMARWYAQVGFLEKVRVIAPEVLRTLHTDVFPAYQEITLHEKPCIYNWDSAYLLTSLEERINFAHEVIAEAGATPTRLKILNRLTSFANFRDEFLHWCDAWHWHDEWQMDAALDTLRHWWYGGDEPLGWGLFCKGEEIRFGRDEMRFSFEHEGWMPSRQTWKDAAAELRRAFEEQVGEYRERLERLAIERGLEKAPVKRGSDPARHLEWLVRWQCQRWTKREIADTYHATPAAVTDGIECAAQLVGVTLRKGKPGRPRKTRG
jgi:hypothetical protein